MGDIEMTEPVEPEIRESDVTWRSKEAVRITMKYIEGLSLVYDIDERFIATEVVKQLEMKPHD